MVPGTYVFVIVLYAARELAHRSFVTHAFETCAHELSSIAHALETCEDEPSSKAQAGKTCADELYRL